MNISLFAKESNSAKLLVVRKDSFHFHVRFESVMLSTELPQAIKPFSICVR